MDYDIYRPWLTLDPWQKEYIFSKETQQDNFLLTTRQGGKTTAMSMRAVELCLKLFKKGDYVLINSITEKQAQHMLTKALTYAKEKYFDEIIWSGKHKPTMHRLMFKNGTGILCYAAGETGQGQRGFTIKKVLIDEGSRMSEEYFEATMPMLSVSKGSMDIASTPAGKKHKDGSEKFFFKCSKDKGFKKYYISAKDCPRHSKKFLKKQRGRMSKLAYAQEYEAIFTDELKRLFDDDLINELCILSRKEIINKKNDHYLGVDIAGFGKDENTFEVFEKLEKEKLEQRENVIEKRNYTTETTTRITILDKSYDLKKIGVDDGGVGFGVYSELMDQDQTKGKTIALNNSSRDANEWGTKSKKLLKEEMYINLLTLMENKKIYFLDDDEVRNSLSSIQHDDGRIYGSYSHVVEGIIRAVWLATKDKDLKLFVHSF